MSEFWTMVGIAKQVSPDMGERRVRLDFGSTMFTIAAHYQWTAYEARDLARRLLQAANEIDGLGFDLFGPASRSKRPAK